MRRLKSNCEQRSRLGTHNSKLTTHLHSRLDSSRSKSKTPTELSTHRQKPHLFPASTVMEAQALHGLSTHQEGFTFLAQLSGPSFYCVRPHNSPGDCTSHTEQKATATYPCKGPRSSKMLATYRRGMLPTRATGMCMMMLMGLRSASGARGWSCCGF